MTKKYQVYYRPYGNHYKPRLFHGFVKIAGHEFKVIQGEVYNSSVVVVGKKPYPVNGEPGENGKSWARYVEVCR